jgi:ABC-2 type transport system permease protein
VPWGLFLVALRIFGQEPFDYRPLLSFLVALASSGAGFLAMGVFFSSLTRNQIASAVLTFVGMLLLTMVFFVKLLVEAQSAGLSTSAWLTVLKHVSYVDLWINSLTGLLMPQFLLFPLSLAVLGLFLAVKVLEARKWA